MFLLGISKTNSNYMLKSLYEKTFRQHNIWKPQTVTTDCVVTILAQTDAEGFSIPPITPRRSIKAGDKVTVTGGADACKYVTLADGEKVAIADSECRKIMVED